MKLDQYKIVLSIITEVLNKKGVLLLVHLCAGATGFEPAISALTGPHVSRYTTPPEFSLTFVSDSLNGRNFSTGIETGQVI